MTDPKQPEPVLNAGGWAGLVTAIVGTTLTILAAARVITPADQQSLLAAFAPLITAAAGIASVVVAVLHARKRVTPLASPRDAQGRPLVVHPALYGPHAATPAEPLDDWPAAIKAAAPTTYVVGKGDTLSSIAAKLGLDWHDLAAWNGISAPYTIHPGDELRTTPPTPAPDPVQELRETVAALSEHLEDELTALKSRIAALEPKPQPSPDPSPPPTPQPTGTAFGVNASAKGQHDAYAKLLPGVRAWRYYFQNGEGLDNPADADGGYQIGDGEFYVISFRDFLTVDQIAAALRKLPTDRTTYVCWCHEPGDQLGLRTTKKPAFTKAQYDDMYHRLRLAQQQVGDRIVIIAILEGIAFLAGNNPDDELPAAGDYDVIGVDPYFAGSIGQPWAKVDQVLDTYKAAADKRGKPWAVCEVGVGQGLTGQARLDALAALPGKLAARGALFVCYFLGKRNRIQWTLSAGDGSADAWTKGARGITV